MNYRDNLAKLADGILRIPSDNFDMEHFSSSNDADENGCGSCGCIIGHAPSILHISKVGYDWDDYSEHITGLTSYSLGWSWMFDYDWKFLDNTTEGAAFRMRFFLKHGVPEFFPYYHAGDKSGMRVDPDQENQFLREYITLKESSNLI